MDVSQKTADPILENSVEQFPAKVGDVDEIALVDILKFLQRQFKVIGGVTFLVIMIATVTNLITPKQSRREVIVRLSLPLEINLSSDDALSDALQDPVLVQEKIAVAANLALAQDFSAALSNQAGPALVTASFSPSTDERPERFQLLLKSADPDVLEEASKLALDSVQVAAGNVVESYLEPEIAWLDVLIQRKQEKVNRLANQSRSNTTINNGSPTELANVLQLSQQSALAEEISRLIDYELQRDSLLELQARDEPLVGIKVVMESQAQVSSSLLQKLVLSMVAGLMVGILIAIVVDQLPHNQTHDVQH
ncbi:MAG: hypothetical protein AAGD09_00670 [Cyanobacteria bacterium P01_F01_bin.56]